MLIVKDIFNLILIKPWEEASLLRYISEEKCNIWLNNMPALNYVNVMQFASLHDFSSDEIDCICYDGDN